MRVAVNIGERSAERFASMRAARVQNSKRCMRAKSNYVPIAIGTSNIADVLRCSTNRVIGENAIAKCGK
eukprot:3418943-Pleurochrysis_carterae.AAC.1